MRDGVCLSSEQLSKDAKKAGAPISLGRWLAMVIACFFRGECPASFVNCVRKRICLKKLFKIALDVHMVFLKSGLISVEECSRLDDYECPLNVIRA